MIQVVRIILAQNRLIWGTIEQNQKRRKIIIINQLTHAHPPKLLVIQIRIYEFQSHLIQICHIDFLLWFPNRN